MTSTIIISSIAFILGLLLTYLYLKANSVMRSEYESSTAQLNQTNSDLKTQQAIVDELRTNLRKIEDLNFNLTEKNRNQESKIAELNASLISLKNSYEEEKNETNDLRTKINSLNDLLTEINIDKTRLDASNKSLQEKLDTQKKELEDLSKRSLLEFESLANKIFDEKTLRFSQTSKENLVQILNPLKENLSEFKKKVEETYDKESQQRFSLETKIKELVELNQQISKDATNLTNALKGQAKTQGNWGEMILESILENSGLTKDREYFVQESYKDDEGKRKQPDVVIKYPDDRKIIIDSKVSLTAYERFANSDSTDQQKIYLDEHLRSIKNHIDGLSAKEYEKLDKTLDFVMLFVPIEPAYMTAIHYDQELWNYAYKKRVILISPTNLIAALKLVADIWKREHQNKNAEEIAKRGEKLYDKFVGFIDDMQGIGKSLESAKSKYDGALNKLTDGRGNLIRQAEDLKSLGINTKKSLPDELLDK